MELTIKQACEQPQNFMYVWATDEFLAAIQPKYATVIRAKRANQQKLLALSAEKYLGSLDKVDQYYTAIRQAFIDAYGMKPVEALVILAQGGSVAGKNWSEGVFGIGATLQFAGTDITVRPKDGYFERNGKILPGDEDLNVYATVGGKTVVFQRFYEDSTSGVTYMSQLNKVTKKYYAASYSTKEGTFKASGGSKLTASESADIWSAIIGSLGEFITWIINLFGSGKKTLTTENTLPNQQNDGFVQTTGGVKGGNMLEGNAGLLLAAAAAGVLIFGMKK